MRHHESSGQPNEQSQLAGPTTVLSAVGFSSSGVVAGTTAHTGLRDHNNYLVKISESPKMHPKSFICPSWIILVKYFWKIELSLVSAPAERKETSSGRKIRKNQDFSILLNGDQGSSYYKKWLQYQMLGTMRGLKWSTLVTPIITAFSDLWGVS